MSVYATPPQNEQELLEWLKNCIEESIDRENDDWESIPDYIPEDETITADTDFFSSEYGNGMVVGPFHDAAGNIWSFVIDKKSIKKIT